MGEEKKSGARDTNLLLGAAALELGLLSPEDLVRAVHQWALTPEKELARILMEMNFLTEDQCRRLREKVVPASSPAEEEGGGTIHYEEGEEPASFLSEALALAEQASSPLSMTGESSSSGPRPAVSLPELSGPAIRGVLDDLDQVSLAQPERYKIRSERGRGAIGRVMIAFDEHIGREVALKELLPLPASGPLGSGPSQSPRRITTAATARFLREARITGQLEHPGIVPVYEIARRHDGSLYYTMRLVRGETMAERLKKCTGLRDRLRLLPNFLSLCQAMAYAHSRGVIHRDLKPANIIIGEFGETVVLDWGLAKVRGIEDVRAEALEESLRLIKEAGAEETVKGRPIGTPSYMSPEQAEGRIDEIDERSDVWSLGAILYETLTGRPPFTGRSAWEVIGRVINSDVSPIVEAEPQAPPELTAIAHKCLRRDKSERYPHAGALAEDIANFQSGGLVSAYEYHFLALFKRFLVRYWPWVAVAASLVLSLFIGGGAWFLLRQEKERARYHELVSVYTQANSLGEKGKRAHAEYLLNNFVGRYPEYALAYFIRGYFYSTQKDYDKAIADNTRVIELDPSWLDAYFNRGVAFADKGDLDAAVADFTKVIESNPARTDAYISRSSAWYKKKDYDRALADLDQALALEPENVLARANRGSILFVKGEIEKGLAECARALELDPTSADALLCRGACLQSLGRQDEALADYSRAIELSPQSALAYCNRGNVYYSKGEYGKAKEDYARAAEIDAAYVGAWLGLGHVATKEGKWEEAVNNYKHAAELTPDDPDVWYHCGVAAENFNGLEKALEYYQRSLELDPKNASAYLNRANILVRQGEWEKALADYDRAIELKPDNALAYANRCNLFRQKEEWEKARADCNRALELQPDHPTFLIYRGNVAYGANEMEAALADYSRALELDPENLTALINRGHVYFYKKDYSAALADYNRVVEKDPENAVAFVAVGRACYYRGDYEGALRAYLRSLELKPEEAEALNAAAWILATAPYKHLRDGRRALELATRLNEHTSWKQPLYFDTLAAAWAEIGDFPKAIEWQEKALAALTEEKAALYRPIFEERLQLYRQRRPYREKEKP